MGLRQVEWTGDREAGRLTIILEECVEAVEGGQSQVSMVFAQESSKEGNAVRLSIHHIESEKYTKYTCTFTCIIINKT